MRFEVFVEVGTTLSYEIEAESYENACTEAEERANKDIHNIYWTDDNIDIQSSYASEI